MAKKRKRTKTTTSTPWKWILLIICVIGLISVAIVNHYLASKATHFGIHIPEGFHTHGIDISQYQGKIDWEKVCAPQDSDVHISFVFMRATMGMRTDKKFKFNWQEAKKHGLKRGAYLYFHPNKDGVKQADLFIKRVGSLNGCLAPVVDIEQTQHINSKTMQQRLQACLNRLHNYYGIRPILYTYTTFYRDFLGADFDKYPLWIAHYERDEKPDYLSRPWDIWQHSERGRIGGISEYVDFNVLNCKNGIMPCEVCGKGD